MLRIPLLLIAALAAPLLVGQEKPATKDESKDKTVAGAERKTPFGTSKVQKKSEDAKPATAPANVRAFDQGDTVRFERPTPFGVTRWVRKKSELNDVERAVWERDRRKTAQTQPPSK
jgi:hypothetical protein